MDGLLSLGHDRQGHSRVQCPYCDGVVNTPKAAVSSTDVKLPLTRRVGAMTVRTYL